MEYPEPKKLEDLNRTYKEIRAKAAAEIKNALHQYFLALHTQVPELRSVSWNQYTPYFNDGDTCYFGVYAGDSILINDEHEGYTVFDKENSPVSKEVAEAAEKLASYIESMSEDFLLDAFGDHAKITITPAGILVEEYYHD